MTLHCVQLLLFQSMSMALARVRYASLRKLRGVLSFRSPKLACHEVLGQDTRRIGSAEKVRAKLGHVHGYGLLGLLILSVEVETFR